MSDYVVEDPHEFDPNCSVCRARERHAAAPTPQPIPAHKHEWLWSSSANKEICGGCALTVMAALAAAERDRDAACLERDRAVEDRRIVLVTAEQRLHLYEKALERVRELEAELAKPRINLVYEGRLKPLPIDREEFPDD